MSGSVQYCMENRRTAVVSETHQLGSKDVNRRERMLQSLTATRLSIVGRVLLRSCRRPGGEVTTFFAFRSFLVSIEAGALLQRYVIVIDCVFCPCPSTLLALAHFVGSEEIHENSRETRD